MPTSDPGTAGGVDAQSAPVDTGTTVDAGAAPDGGGTQSGPEDMNAGFIGGSCIFDWECGHQEARCLVDPWGFPMGSCGMFCDRVCPDRPGFTETFCVAPGALGSGGDEGLCMMKCDFAQSPTGCRAGYQCYTVPRHTEPNTTDNVCLPSPQPEPPPEPPCLQQLLDRGVQFQPAGNARDTPDGRPNVVCDIDDPVMLEPVMHGVSFRYSELTREPTRLYASCPLALALDTLAEYLAGRGVTDVTHLGIYNCRVIAGTDNLSEHGLANAFDLAGLKLSTGEEYVILGDWETGKLQPVTAAGRFLRDVAEDMYSSWTFHIILTPDYDAAHANHLHMDLTEGSYFFR